MKPLISEEKIEELKDIEGEVKGVALQENMDFVLKKEGEEGLRKLEKETERLGCPIKRKEIKAMTFYPLWWDAVLLLAIKELFGYGSQEFEEMGRFEPKTSFIVRIFMKYFVSIERATTEVPRLWRQAFTVGDIEVAEYNKEKRQGVIRLKNYKLVPLQCDILRGYFSSILQLMVGKEVQCEETKCSFRGDEYHEFLLSW